MTATASNRWSTALSLLRPRPRIDRFEVGIVVVLAAASVWVLGQEVVLVLARGGVWTGINGIFLVDQFQYLAWIRDASRHVLASNLFVLRATPHDYLQPGIAISGGLVALGVAPWAALLAWQPVALAGVFLAVRAFVYRQLASTLARRTALLLALFAGWGPLHVDLWLPFWTWGYPFSLLGLACAVGSLLAYDRARTGARGVWLAALVGALACWLHPWQGEILLIVILGAEVQLWSVGQRPTARRVVPMLLSVMAPLAYFMVLDQTDTSWHLAQEATIGADKFSSLTAMLWPLALPAALAYRRRPRTFVQAATHVWPLAALAVFLLSEHGLGSGPMHAFLGISVPLAVLAVEGAAELPPPRLAIRRAGALLAALALIVPVAVRELRYARRLVLKAATVTPDDQAALNYLRGDPEPGGVFATFAIGTRVPADTARHTYVGDCFWSLPHCAARKTNAWRVLDWGRLSPRQAIALVSTTGTRFVFQNCRAHGDVENELGPIIHTVHRFGCATIYEIGWTRNERNPLAGSGQPPGLERAEKSRSVRRFNIASPRRINATLAARPSIGSRTT